MGGSDNLIRGKSIADGDKVSDQPAERKKGLVDWVNFVKPANEEKDHWVSSDAFFGNERPFSSTPLKWL